MASTAASSPGWWTRICAIFPINRVKVGDGPRKRGGGGREGSAHVSILFPRFGETSFNVSGISTLLDGRR
jgi:hypothetical protein